MSENHIIAEAKNFAACASFVLFLAIVGVLAWAAWQTATQ